MRVVVVVVFVFLVATRSTSISSLTHSISPHLSVVNPFELVVSSSLRLCANKIAVLNDQQQQQQQQQRHIASSSKSPATSGARELSPNNKQQPPVNVAHYQQQQQQQQHHQSASSVVEPLVAKNISNLLGFELDEHELAQRGAYYVKSVDAASASAAAGLKQGDKITKINGKPTLGMSHDEFCHEIAIAHQYQQRNNMIHLMVMRRSAKSTGSSSYQATTTTTSSSSKPTAAAAAAAGTSSTATTLPIKNNLATSSSSFVDEGCYTAPLHATSGVISSSSATSSSTHADASSTAQQPSSSTTPVRGGAVVTTTTFGKRSSPLRTTHTHTRTHTATIIISAFTLFCLFVCNRYLSIVRSSCCFSFSLTLSWLLLTPPTNQCSISFY